MTSIIEEVSHTVGVVGGEGRDCEDEGRQRKHAVHQREGQGDSMIASTVTEGAVSGSVGDMWRGPSAEPGTAGPYILWEGRMVL